VAGQSFHYSFILPAGACSRYDGRGILSDIDPRPAVRRSKSLSEGAITIPGYTVDGWQVHIFSESGFFDPGKRIRDYTEEELQTFLFATYEGCPEGLSAEGQGKPAAAPSGVRRARCRLQPALNAVGSTQPGCAGLPDRQDQHRRRGRDADQRSRRLGT
jgi:hypothetical protein